MMACASKPRRHTTARIQLRTKLRFVQKNMTLDFVTAKRLSKRVKYLKYRFVAGGKTCKPGTSGLLKRTECIPSVSKGRKALHAGHSYCIVLHRMKEGYSNFAKLLLMWILLCECTSSFATYLIPIHYWRRNEKGREEEFTVLIVLKDYYGRVFGDTVPWLQQGNGANPEFTPVLISSSQETYIKSLAAHTDHYGDSAEEVATHAQSPNDLAKSPNSGVYVFDAQGKLVLSYQIAVPEPGKDLPEFEAEAGPPEEGTLTWRTVTGAPRIQRNGNVDISKPAPKAKTQVYEKGQIALKGFYTSSKTIFRIVPEIFNLTSWMFEVSNEVVPVDKEKAPEGLRYWDGSHAAEGSGAFVSKIRCLAFSDDLKELYERLGFSAVNKDGPPHHMEATPETMSQKMGEVREALARHPGAAIARWDTEFMNRLSTIGAGDLKQPCVFSSLVNMAEWSSK